CTNTIGKRAIARRLPCRRRQPHSRADYALAFDRRAADYRAAPRPPPPPHPCPGWREGLGEALAHAGRPADAGAMLLRAAADAPTSRRIELQRMAAEQLLIGGPN